MEIENLARTEACMLIMSKVKCCSSSFNIYSRGSVKKWHENWKLLAKNAEGGRFSFKRKSGRNSKKNTEGENVELIKRTGSSVSYVSYCELK